MSELLVFEEDMKESEGKWPVELLVTVGGPGNRTLTLLDRDAYKELATGTLWGEEGGVAGGVAPGECECCIVVYWLMCVLCSC